MSVLNSETLPLLLHRTRIQSGDTIVDVGCGDGSLVDALLAGGYDAHGIDDDATETDRVICGSPAAGLPLDGQSAQLAIVRGCDAFAGATLSEPETFVAMANVLAAIAGKGAVAFATGEPEAAIAILSRFGIEAELTSLAPPVGLIGRLLGRKPAASASLVIGQLPARPLTKLEYHTIAREAAMESMTAMRRAA